MILIFSCCGREQKLGTLIKMESSRHECFADMAYKPYPYTQAFWTLLEFLNLLKNCDDYMTVVCSIIEKEAVV